MDIRLDAVPPGPPSSTRKAYINNLAICILHKFKVIRPWSLPNETVSNKSKGSVVEREETASDRFVRKPYFFSVR